MYCDNNRDLDAGVDFGSTVSPILISSNIFFDQVSLCEVDGSFFPDINVDYYEMLKISFNFDVDICVLNILNCLVELILTWSDHFQLIYVKHVHCIYFMTKLVFN